MLPLLHPSMTALAFFQGTQLNLFERFLNQAVSGINSTSITSGMQNVAYVVMLIGFLWQVYQAVMHGGDVRSLGTSLVKYVVTALVVMNYSAIFTTVNQGFVNAGSWVANASGGNVFENWLNDLKTQYSQDGVQQLWGLITGSMAGLIDGLLIIVAYILYPFVVAIFGFFYIFYGAILYIFGPIVIALMPLGATNRLAKAYVENIFIWNSWPILYGGFGALLSAVQMGQVGQMLNQNDFLGGLGNLEGSFLIGIASIIYSLAIAVIPFIAKKIVSGEVGSTATALLGAAVTAVTAGMAGVEGAAAGLAAGSGSSAGAQGTGSAAAAGSATSGQSSTAGNRPAPPQTGTTSMAGDQPVAASSQVSGEPSLAGHAEQIRGDFSDVMGAPESQEAADDSGVASEQQSSPASAAGSSSGSAAGGSRPSGSRSSSVRAAKRGPTVHRYNLGTWGAYHAARLVARGVAGTVRGSGDEE
jgi:hypothetical protein